MTTNNSNLFDILGNPRFSQITANPTRSPKTHYLKAIDYELYLTADREHWSSDIKKAQMFSIEAAKALARVYRVYGKLGKIEITAKERQSA